VVFLFLGGIFGKQLFGLAGECGVFAGADGLELDPDGGGERGEF